MNLDELRSVQNAERRKSGLQSLRQSFYEEAGEYVASLKEQRERAAERADDPFSDPEVKRLSDEIETAEEVIEAIYERRMGKLLKRASLAASEMSADEEGLTAEERDLFHDIVERIRANKSTVLDTVAGEGDGGADHDEGTPPSPDPSTETGSADGVSAADAMGGATDDPAENGESVDPVGDPNLTTGGDGAERTEVPPREAPTDPSPPEDRTEAPTAGASGGTVDPGAGAATDTGTADPATDAGPGAETGGTDRVTVRITRDVGEIFGVDDRQYDLASEDVVQLPEQNADPLVQRDAAERLD